MKLDPIRRSTSASRMNFQVFARGEGAEAVTRVIGLSEPSSTAVINGTIKGKKGEN